MTTTEYTVKGMTCGHCVGSVQSELINLDGVTDVSVDLATGTVVISSESPLERSAVEAAVDEAGYELAS